MKAVILQYFGIGDVIFSQGVARHLMDQDYSIEWPVKPEFIEGLQRAYPDIHFTDYTNYPPELFLIKKDCIRDGVRIIPLRWSDQILGKPSRYWMRAKYDLFELDYNKWKQSAHFQRNPQKEQSLFDLFGITPGHPFNLVNTMFRSDASGSIVPQINNGLPVVQMTVMAGLSLFDWALMIEHATEIHVANSAILYLLELLDLQAREVHLYCRKPDETDFRYVDYLFTKDYKLHY